MWLLWAIPAALLLLFSGLVGTKTTKRLAKRGRKKLYRWTKKRTTQRWKARGAARKRISTTAMVQRKARNDRIAGRTPKPKKAAKPSIAQHKYVCNGRTREGHGCRNPTTQGQDRCYLHQFVSVR